MDCKLGHSVVLLCGLGQMFAAVCADVNEALVCVGMLSTASEQSDERGSCIMACSLFTLQFITLARTNDCLPPHRQCVKMVETIDPHLCHICMT